MKYINLILGLTANKCSKNAELFITREYFFLSMLKTQLKLASPPFFSPADEVDTKLDQLVHTQSRKLLCSL